jgi:hypothetical protein
MKKFFSLLLILFCVIAFQSSYSQLFVENFDYPVGDSIINHGWVNHSGSGTQIVVVSGSLTYTGYPGSGTGNSVVVAGGSGSREDVHANFTPQGNSGSLYAALLVNLSTAATTGDYFFHLAPVFPTTFFKPRVFVRDDGSGNLQFGITKAIAGSTVYTPAIYSYNTTYLLVVKYEFSPGDSNDVGKLFINPPLANEPPAPDLTTTDLVPDDSIGAVCLRQGANAYTVQVDGIIVGTTWSSVVPVELTSFTASSVGNNAVLRWSTATELNNLGFEMQRLENENEFATIGFIQGKGTTTEPQNYSFIDENLSSGTYTYRLKQVDFNGTYTFSDAVSVEIVNNLIEFELAQNYPNPFNPSTTIKFSIPQSSVVSLKVFNALGQEVKTLVNGYKEAGYHSVYFDASELNSGIYFYRIEAGEFTEVRKMTLIR